VLDIKSTRNLFKNDYISNACPLPSASAPGAAGRKCKKFRQARGLPETVQA
jgi:hypothetical protein